MQRPRRPNRQSRRGGHDNQNSAPHQTHSPRPPRSAQSYTSVPSFSSLHPGTGVSIVLKQDQPTGHQVQGIVSETLTRGDHPRGVKVRLRDGRVGRVQKLVSEDEGLRGENLVGGTNAGLGRDGESESTFERRGGGGRSRGRGAAETAGFRHVQDVRDDEYMYDENAPRSLGAYFTGLDELEARDAEGSNWTGEEDRGTVPEFKSEMAKCPVCGAFEGDERAVAHHVEGHFADG